MPVYTKFGPFINGAAPGISAPVLNGFETQLAAVQYGLNIITSFQLASNVTIAPSATTAFTATGVGGVPSTAVAVLVSAFYTAGTAGMHADFTPHGITWSNGNYPSIQGPTTALYGQSFVIPLSSGQFDVRANGGNIAGIYIWMYAYIN